MAPSATGNDAEFCARFCHSCCHRGHLDTPSHKYFGRFELMPATVKTSFDVEGSPKDTIDPSWNPDDPKYDHLDVMLADSLMIYLEKRVKEEEEEESKEKADIDNDESAAVNGEEKDDGTSCLPSSASTMTSSFDVWLLTKCSHCRRRAF